MNKLDVLMVILAFASYLAIKIDARNYDNKIHRYENIRAKQKLYLEHVIATKNMHSTKPKND